MRGGGHAEARGAWGGEGRRGEQGDGAQAAWHGLRDRLGLQRLGRQRAPWEAPHTPGGRLGERGVRRRGSKGYRLRRSGTSEPLMRRAVRANFSQHLSCARVVWLVAWPAA